MLATTASAQPALPGFTEALVASGLQSPTAMEFAPDGRLFVLEQGGRVRVIKNGSLLAAPFMTKTVSSSGERGMLGIAFDPDFAATQYVYLYYTSTTQTIRNRVSRVRANGDVMESGSEAVLLDLPTRRRQRRLTELAVAQHDARQTPAHQLRRLDPDGQPVLFADGRNQSRHLAARSTGGTFYNPSSPRFPSSYGSRLRIYRNGTRESSLAATGSINTSSNPLRLGGNSVWGEYFAGRLDDVRIYNRALSGAEIQGDMNRPVR